MDILGEVMDIRPHQELGVAAVAVPRATIPHRPRYDICMFNR